MTVDMLTIIVVYDVMYRKILQLQSRGDVDISDVYIRSYNNNSM